jgi:hypothetical protein
MAESQYEYEIREIRRAQRRADEVRNAPLADRREAQAAFFDAIRDQPDHVGDVVGWLLNGSYGYGEQQLALRILNSPRMNRVAALTQMAAVFEWQCPEDRARQAWKRLTAPEKAQLAYAVQDAIRDAEEEA